MMTYKEQLKDNLSEAKKCHYYQKSWGFGRELAIKCKTPDGYNGVHAISRCIECEYFPQDLVSRRQ